jgi:hypothetical protein
MNLRVRQKHEKYRKIMEAKLSTTVETLCDGLPTEILHYLRYCQSLKFDEDPDYSYLRQMLKMLFLQEHFEYDFVYEWTLLGNKTVTESTNETNKVVGANTARN